MIKIEPDNGKYSVSQWDLESDRYLTTFEESLEKAFLAVKAILEN